MFSVPFHSFGVALALAFSSCGLGTLSPTALDDSPRGRHDEQRPAESCNRQRASIVHAASPDITTCTTAFDAATAPDA